MFFRRSELPNTPEKGEMFQRRVAFDLVETARIRAVTTGPGGIRHICFRISTSGLDDQGEQRILAADVFSQMYQPT